MGLGLSKPQEPLPVLALAVCAPSLFSRWIQYLEREALANSSLGTSAALGNMLKAYGVPPFIIGHWLICQKKGFKDFTDWSYILGCVFLDGAFIGTYKGKPQPEMILASGLSLMCFGLPLRKRALAAGAPAGLPTIGACAGLTLAYLGTQLIMVKNGLMKQVLPGLNPAQLGQLASALFGLANFVRFFQLLQADAVLDEVKFGQFLKILASSTLLTGNALILNWQAVQIPGAAVFNIIAAVAMAAIMSPVKKKKMVQA